MAENHIIYGFTAGEVAPEFFGRTDLTKYALGVQKAENFFVDYRGGLVSRAGSRLVGQVAGLDKASKLFRFKAQDNDFILLFGDFTMRVIRSGGYVLEAGKTITNVTSASPAVVTSTAHGYTAGDWVILRDVVGTTELNKKTFEVGTVTANTYQLLHTDGTSVDSTTYGAYISGGVSERIYTQATIYAAEDLDELQLEQRFNTATLTHIDYPRMRLTYVSDTSWTFAAITSGVTTASPSGLTVTPSTAGTAGVAYVVTAIGADGSESLPTPYKINELCVDFTVGAGTVLLSWSAVAGAQEYLVYRTLLLPTGADMTLAQEVGYIGRALGPQFVDTNIVPDFTKSPPLGRDPFANAQVDYITITAQGSGYSKSATVTVSGGGGTGFVGYPVVNNAGNILGVTVVSHGSGYSSATVAFAGGGGTGATGTVALGPTTGNNPRTFKVFQQRGVYAGTANAPMTIEGSKPNQLDNMGVSTTINDGDAYSFTLDEQSVNPIKHLVALRSGLLAFTDGGVTQLRAEEGKAVTPLNALAEPQIYKGVSQVTPLAINLDVLFTQQQGASLQAVTYTQYTNSFDLQDLSILASHLTGEGKEITRMTYMEEPHRIVLAPREDGMLLVLTYVREQEVFAWARETTKGLYRDVLSVSEINRDTVYQIVERKLNGTWRKYIEVKQPRNWDYAYNHWGVDCGLNYVLDSPVATITPSAATGEGITVTASAAVFGATSIGDIIWAMGGKLEVTSVDSSTQLTCNVLIDWANIQAQDLGNSPVAAKSGSWEIGTPVYTVSGLDHLEGELVSIFADGDVYLDRVVTGGAISIDRAATKIVVGLPYKCQAQTLSVTTNQVLVEGKRKDVLGVAARLSQTRGLSVGSSFDKMFEMRDRSDEDWGAVLKLRSDMPYRFINHAWDEDGYIYFEQKYPLPATLLGYVSTVDLGDT